MVEYFRNQCPIDSLKAQVEYQYALFLYFVQKNRNLVKAQATLAYAVLRSPSEFMTRAKIIHSKFTIGV